MTFDDWAMILTDNKANLNINEMNIEQAYSFFSSAMTPQTK